jgi:acyl-coenzyme A thioesterase PaaI-like protein
MPEQAHSQPDQTRFGKVCHPSCIVCGAQNRESMRLSFSVGADGSVEAPFGCDADYQGYPDRLHGGVIAMLLDAAMTHCLFARHVRAVTARLNIRYRMAVRLGREASVRAKIVRETSPLYLLEAEIVQDGQVCAVAEAKFLEDTAHLPAKKTVAASESSV